MFTINSLSKYLYQVFWTGLDWLYPPKCAGCGAVGIRWCYCCHAKVEQVPHPVCSVCGAGNQSSQLCQNCRIHKPAYDGLRSWALYTDPIRQAIHQLKYERDITLGEILSRPMEQVLLQTGWQVDMIVPVPLSPDRARQRGYNQSTFLALPLAISLKIPLRSAALSRVRETVAQVGLSSRQRRINVDNAFEADPHIVGGKSVLVIDDVTTTGATMEACANALKKAGANFAFGLTLARSNWPDQAGKFNVLGGNV